MGIARNTADDRGEARNRVFLDYLDLHAGFGASVFNSERYKVLRLKFDILAFPDKQLFVAAPALAKSNTSLVLVAQQHIFNPDRPIRPVLPPAANKSMAAYVRNRISLLSARMDHRELSRSYEYAGYTRGHWRTLFENIPAREQGALIEERSGNADLFYRKWTIKQIEQGDFFAQAINRGVIEEDILEYIIAAAEDTATLFQREALITDISARYPLSPSARSTIESLFNRGFDACNAYASNSTPSSDTESVDGAILRSLARHLPFGVGRTLYEVVNFLPIKTVVSISKDESWLMFLRELRNTYDVIHAEYPGDFETMIELVAFIERTKLYVTSIAKFSRRLVFDWSIAFAFTSVSPMIVSSLIGSAFANLIDVATRLKHTIAAVSILSGVARRFNDIYEPRVEADRCDVIEAMKKAHLSDLRAF